MKLRTLYFLATLMVSLSQAHAGLLELQTIHCLSAETANEVFEVFVKIDQHPKATNIIIFGVDEPIKLSKPISITYGMPYTRLAGINVYHADLFGKMRDLYIYMDARIGIETEFIVSRGHGTLEINGLRIPLVCGGM